jgi:hypothetical protein
MPSDLEFIKSIQAGPYAKRDLRVAEARAQSEKALDALTAIFDAEAHEAGRSEVRCGVERSD